MPKLFLFSLFFYLSCPIQGKCQPAKESSFELIYLSNDIKYSAAKLNTEVKKAKNLQEVKTIVRKRVIENKGYIVISFLKNGLYYRWERRMGKIPAESTEEWDMLGVRDAGHTAVNSPEQLSGVFYDTLIIIDTLNIRVTDRSVNGMEGSYNIRCRIRDSIFTNNIPVYDFNKLQFTQSLFGVSPKEGVRIQVFKKDQPAVTLATGIVFMPDKELKNEWLLIAKGLKKSKPELMTNEVAGYLNAYITKKYGRCIFEELNSWLLKSL